PAHDPRRGVPAVDRERGRPRERAAPIRSGLGPPGIPPVSPHTARRTTMTSLTAPPGSNRDAPESTKTRALVGGGTHRSTRRVDPVFHLFLLPILIVFTAAITLPAIMGFVYSFTDSIGFGDFSFIGLTNYIAAFGDP